ncbi:winged helix-turn-helix transcriptional regulator [Lentzea sp. NPDC059081]|uniref:winged helix-turn-helix transcriptional regulator n=1 Tax=Lentzea sp. NPDC059081 TaxID=3346719 RepID=UPI0036AFF0B3
MEHITSKWGVLVLLALSDGGSWRFSELRRELANVVSEKMLTQTLRTLERDGFVDRDVKPVIPPHVEYVLTPLGKGAARHLTGLYHWIEANQPEVSAAQRHYDEA